MYPEIQEMKTAPFNLPGDVIIMGDKGEERHEQWIERLSGLKLLGELLVEGSKINKKQLKEALTLSGERKIRLGEALSQLGFINEKDILDVFGKYLGMRVIDSLDVKFLEKNEFHYGFFSKFSMEAIDKLCVLPLKLDVKQIPGKSSMVWYFHFVINDPWQYSDIRRVVEDYVRKERAETMSMKKITGGGGELFEEEDIRVEIIGYLALKNEITDVLGEIQGRAASMAGISGGGSVVEENEEAAARGIREILSNAITQKATDIHITPLHRNGGLWVRYRIDGELIDVVRDGRYEIREYNTFLNKCLIMAKIDHTEKRRPQSGSLQFSFNRDIYDVRVETIPTSMSSIDSDGRGLDGSKVLFRILYKEMSFSVDELGFSPDDVMVLRKLYTKPSGVFLVTGPTSSGKTTTIYSIIKHLDAAKQSIYTVEDPVEYYLEGATQISVNEKEGRGFAPVLKSLMRLDPNIVFMGEMRDPESARTAMQIANTGHSVFSTLHTNSAYTSPQRLVSMNVEPYLIIGNLNGIVSQRLVRANCKNCLEPYTPSGRTLRALGLDPDASYIHGSGRINGHVCPVCGGTGMKGRVGIFEVLPLSEYEGWEKHLSDPYKLRNFFRERGHGDLLDDAKRKMGTGLISPDSLFGVLARMEVLLEEDTKKTGL